MSQTDYGEFPQTDQSYPLLQLVEKFSAELILTEVMHALRGSSLTIWDREGTMLLSNSYMSREFKKKSPYELLGENLKDYSPKEWAQERIDIVNRALDTNQTVTLLEIYCGYRLRTRFIPLKRMDGDQLYEAALISIEQMTVGYYRELMMTSEKAQVVYAHYNGLGKLDVLSNRELEVLALMGQGFRSKEIANMLFRSVSTIKNHRDKIGKKLDVQDRSKLIDLARNAVLLVGDASRGRAQFNFEKSRHGECEQEIMPDYNGTPGRKPSKKVMRGEPELDYQPEGSEIPFPGPESESESE